MSIEQLTLFFMWATIIDGAIITFWGLWIFLLPEVVFKLQTKFIAITREEFNRSMYNFMGFAKLLFLFLNLVPFIVLKIIG